MNTNTAINNPVTHLTPVIDITENLKSNAAINTTPTNNTTIVSNLFSSNPHKVSNKTDPIRDIEDIHKVISYYDNKKQRFNSLSTNIRDRAIFVLGICCGRRINDILSLRYIDIFLDAELRFRPYISIVEQKTNKVARFILQQEAKDALMLYIQTKKEINMGDYIFTSRTTSMNGIPTQNKHVRREQIWASYKEMSRVTGLDLKYNIGTHSARKTAGIMLYEASGNNIDQVRAFYNHANVETTQIYLSTNEADVMQSMSKMSYGI